MKTNKTIFYRWIRIGSLIAGLIGLSVLSFNCGNQSFQSAGSIDSSSILDLGSFDKPNSPYTLMTGEQVYQSMLNVTGQYLQRTTAQRTEYELRSGAMSDDDSIAVMNAPMLLAHSSLAGEVCNGLVAKERVMGINARTFYNGVDFTKSIDANNADVFARVSEEMAKRFYGRVLTSDEASALTTYYVDFKDGLSASQLASSQMTVNLYLSLCAGMLSTFDSVTY